MAGSMKAIKNRIKSIESTKQITKAMELVATSKLKKAKERVEKSRPFFETLRETLDDIADNNKDFSSPFCRDDGNKTACHIVIAGDRGLAGGYNMNLFKSVKINENDIVFPIGKKSIEHYERFNVEIYSRDYGVTEDVSISDCAFIGEELAKAFLNGRFGKLFISYTSFVNVLTQIPATLPILPVTTGNTEKKKNGLILYEPSAEEVYESIVPLYISGMIYGGVCESLASEVSARRNAMESANKNADEMLEDLSLKYNRARQAAITQEITEIVAGAQV